MDFEQEVGDFEHEVNTIVGTFTKLRIPSGDLQFSSGDLQRDFSKV